MLLVGNSTKSLSDRRAPNHHHVVGRAIDRRPDSVVDPDLLNLRYRLLNLPIYYVVGLIAEQSSTQSSTNPSSCQLIVEQSGKSSSSLHNPWNTPSRSLSSKPLPTSSSIDETIHRTSTLSSSYPSFSSGFPTYKVIDVIVEEGTSSNVSLCLRDLSFRGRCGL